MLRAYSIFKDMDKKACETLRKAGIQLDLAPTKERPNKDELSRLLKKYDILIIGVKEKLTKDMIIGLDKKKIIATVSIGVDHIDKSFFESDLFTIINCQKSNVLSVAEHIFALILGLKKRIIEANDIAIKGGTKADLSLRSNDISNSTIGIIGAGKISREVIKIAKVFNMKIYCNTLNPQKHQDLFEKGVEFLNLDTLLSNSDIIVVNIPMNEENNNLISKDRIRKMKKTATFINTSRAELVDVNELIKYADENESFNVGLDIDTQSYKELLNIKRKNVIVTPHIAGVTKEAIKRMDVELVNNIVEYLNK